MCPNCQVQIDSSRITLKKLESHIKKCDSSKLVCIFCLKLFEQTEQVLFENHVQKHLIKQSLERNHAKSAAITVTTPAASSDQSSSRLNNNNNILSTSSSSSIPNNSI